MSTIPYGPDGIYKIGIMKPKGKETNIETGEENDISLFNCLVPTYGVWADPQWAKFPQHKSRLIENIRSKQH